MCICTEIFCLVEWLRLSDKHALEGDSKKACSLMLGTQKFLELEISYIRKSTSYIHFVKDTSTSKPLDAVEILRQFTT